MIWHECCVQQSGAAGQDRAVPIISKTHQLDRVEVSLAQTIVNANAVAAAVNIASPGFGADSRITMNTFGLKLKLIDMGKDDAVPMVAIGLQNKHASGRIIDFLQNANAISNTSGTDGYVAVTKVVNVGGKNVLLNGTLRATKANQIGLLGFGGGAAGNNSYHYKPEVSVGVFMADNVVLGVEYRAKPNNIRALGTNESGAYDLFLAYFINKNMALTAAYANLGQIGPSSGVLAGINPALGGISNKQDGLYLQLQANF